MLNSSLLTYGTIVAQLRKDYNADYAQVNKQLGQDGLTWACA